ncbi:MAG: hypothetical protein ABW023_11200 [Sphingomonas sp.]
MISSALPRLESNAPLARVAVVFFAVLQVLTPALPSLGIGHPIGDQSQAVRTLITPAGWAFSIWGLLYAGSFVFAIFQALPAQRHGALIGHLRWPAAGAFAGNAAWAAYVQPSGLGFPSVLIIAWTLLCLLVAFRTLSAWRDAFSRGELWCAVVPLSALAAWLTVATTVNVAATLRFHGVEGGDATPAISAAIVVAAGAIASAALMRGRGNPAYAAVLLWALSAIYAGGARAVGVVGVAAIAAAALVLIGALTGWLYADAGRWRPWPR